MTPEREEAIRETWNAIKSKAQFTGGRLHARKFQKFSAVKTEGPNDVPLVRAKPEEFIFEIIKSWFAGDPNAVRYTVECEGIILSDAIIYKEAE